MKKIILSIVALAMLLSACSGTPTENINANSGATSSAASTPSEPSSVAAQATNAPLHFFGQMSFGNGTGAPRLPMGFIIYRSKRTTMQTSCILTMPRLHIFPCAAGRNVNMRTKPVQAI